MKKGWWVIILLAGAIFIGCSASTVKAATNFGWTEMVESAIPESLGSYYGTYYDQNHDRIFVNGGYTSNQYHTGTNGVYEGNFQTDGSIVWKKLPNYPIPILGNFSYFDTVSNRLVVTGGDNSPNVYADSYYLNIDPTSGNAIGTWIRESNLPLALHFHGGLVYGNKVYIFGGRNWRDEVQNTIYWRNLGSNGGWTLLSTRLPEAMSSMSLTVVGNRLYVGGGQKVYRSASIGCGLGKVYYTSFDSDGNLGAWSQTTSYPATQHYNEDGNGTRPVSAIRTYHQMVAYQNYMYVLPGAAYTTNNNNQCEILFDPNTQYNATERSFRAPILNNGNLGVWKQVENEAQAKSADMMDFRLDKLGSNVYGTALRKGVIYHFGGMNFAGVTKGVFRMDLTGTLDRISVGGKIINSNNIGLAAIPVKLTNITTGEVVTVMTDQNGVFHQNNFANERIGEQYRVEPPNSSFKSTTVQWAWNQCLSADQPAGSALYDCQQAGYSNCSTQSSTHGTESCNFRYESPKPKVGIYYFGVYSENLAKWKLDNCEKNFGRRDWWCGVKDFYGLEPGIPQNLRGWEGIPPTDYSNRKPVIGYYNNKDVTTSERQIMQMKENGIDFINFYWYWDKNTKDTLGTLQGLRSFFKARNKDQIKFMLTIWPGAPGPVCQLCIKPEDFSLIANKIVNEFMVQPNYLKDSRGRPYLGFGSLDNVSGANTLAGLIKQTAQAKGLQSPFIYANEENYPSNIDGSFCFNPYIINGPQSYQTNYLDKIDGYYNLLKQNSKPLMHCATANFDERPRADIEYSMPADKDKVRYYTDFTFDKYNMALTKAKASMDASTDEHSKIISIYAWDEWHEGGFVEPNVRDGAKFLQMISGVFNLPQGSDPCRITGKCEPYPSPTLAAIPGDADGDGHVDGLDYVIWLSHYGQSVAGVSNGDFDNNGRVDGLDYVIWLSHYN